MHNTIMNTLPYFALLVAAFSGIVTCYDFDDSAYNKVLLAEYEDMLLEPVVSVRSKREISSRNCHSHRNMMFHHLCCAENTLNTYGEVYNEGRKRCRSKIMEKPGKEVIFDPFDCEAMKLFKRKMTCVEECAGKLSGFLDEEGNPIEAFFESRVEEIFSAEPWFAAIQDKLISTCLAEARNTTGNRDAPDSETCNPAGIRLTRCLFREIQLNCPASVIKDEEACTRLRDALEKEHKGQRQPPIHFHPRHRVD